MAWKLIFLCIIVFFCNLATTAAQNQDKVYFVDQNCTSDRVTENSTYGNNLITLLSLLSFHANTTLFYKNTIFGRTNSSDSTVYGMFTCRGDIPFRLCKECVTNATQKLTSDPNCVFSKQALMYYAECTVRYSNMSFFSTLDTSDEFSKRNAANVSSNSTTSFMNFMMNTMNQTAEAAANSGNRFFTKEANLSRSDTLYCLAQCTPDLSPLNCTECLAQAISRIPNCCYARKGVRVMYPSCIVWYELYPFYGLITDNPPKGPVPPPTITSSPPSPGNDRSKTIILILIPTIIVSGILFTFCCYLMIRRRVRKNDKTILRENFGLVSSSIESLQFNFAIIEAATNNFSIENKIGRGGFGQVYKGILIDGKPIAVKRLSRNSKQGVEELKNEVLMIAKLQHRNLVAFIGFCLDEQEKILIYEYVPNKSLDYFLFDSKQEKLLSWSERYKIIRGIAKGILYLHEHSRLKVIHRDLKPSNVLLDENMNPKISDFGLARIIEIDQEEGSTNRIIGTYGYMSPEYAMFGQFSEKSDVYSFGVMILEIISGKKNIRSREPPRVNDDLLNFVWTHWKDGTQLNTLDPKLKDNYSSDEVIKCIQSDEVIKCIQIGLLCVQEIPDDRPTMATIVSYLSSHSIELPSPQEPTFFLHHKMDQTVAHEPSSKQYTNSSISINEMSLSKFYPR